MESSDDASGSSGERVHAVTASDGEEKDARSNKGGSSKQRQVSGARGAERSSWLAVLPIAVLFALSVACATLGPVPLNKSAVRSRAVSVPRHATRYCFLSNVLCSGYSWARLH